MSRKLAFCDTFSKRVAGNDIVGDRYPAERIKTGFLSLRAALLPHRQPRRCRHLRTTGRLALLESPRCGGCPARAGVRKGKALRTPQADEPPHARQQRVRALSEESGMNGLMTRLLEEAFEVAAKQPPQLFGRSRSARSQNSPLMICSPSRRMLPSACSFGACCEHPA